MPWPIPTPDEIFDRAASAYEVGFQAAYSLQFPGAPPAVVDARSPWSPISIDARVLALTAFDLWAFQARASQELMPDTAIDWLPRHAAIWGVPQVQATPATGKVVFVDAGGGSIPAGVSMTAQGGRIYTTTETGTISGGSATIAVAAQIAGAAGSLPSGTILTLVSPVPGLTTMTATVDTGGLQGADAESVDSWRSRILARIRETGAGGNAADFVRWTQEVMPGAIVRAFSPAMGLVTVAFAMPSGTTWRVPTTAEIAVVTAYLNDASVRKPLAAPVISVVGATLQPIDFTLHLSVDTATTRAAATGALAAQILADATIAGTITMARCDAALVSASGEFSHTRTVPSADVTAGASTLSVMGSVTFT